MDTLKLLGVALGLASLAGINLYLTVFATGLAIEQHWITLAPEFQSLAVLGHPAIVIVSGFLYFIQFFADKIPWVDSVWDAIHTVLRPIGGALLAIRVLGTTNPVFDVLIVLLAGSASLLTHSTKAGTRLIANGSPEPFSNVALSVTEDVAVLGGLALIHFNPLLALVVSLLAIATLLYFAPRIWRAVKVKLWLVRRKLNAPAIELDGCALPVELPARIEPLFARINLLDEHIAWAVPCINGGSKKIPGNIFGHLLSTREQPRELHFLARRRMGQIAETIDLTDAIIAHEAKFLSHDLVIRSAEKKILATFLFDRNERARVIALAADLRARAEETSRPVVAASGILG